MKKIPILVAIDSEPNRRLVDPKTPEDWTGFEKTYEFFTELRPRLRAATCAPVHFSWFLRMDPQIVHVYGSADWVAKRYAQEIEQLELAGDDIGLHAHPWRWDEVSNNWIADFGSQEWINHCVELSFQTFQDTFGRQCQTFSFGDHWMNEDTSNLLETLGTRFDFTPQPGLRRVHLEDPHTGTFPDFRHLPRHAYRPSKTNFTTPAIIEPRDLWVIPLSTGSTDWAFTSLDPSADGSLPDGVDGPPVYEGYHDTTDCKWVVGWVWDMNRPETPLNVEICDGETVTETVTANSFRHDLLKAGKGNGKHAFRYLLPDRLRDGKRHPIRVQVAKSSFSLHSTPQEIECYEKTGRGEIDMAMFLNHEPFLFSKVMDKLLTESVSPYLALIARSDIGIKPDEKFYVTQNFEYILNHPLVDRFVFESSPEFVQRIS